MKGLLAAATLALVAATTTAAGRGGADGDVTVEELGRLLFWDPVLSGARDVACATCHHPDLAYTDGRELALGTGSVGLGPDRVDRSGGSIPVVRRNAPTLLNVAFNGADGRRRRRGGERRDPLEVDPSRAPMFWDSRVRGLEAQALEPIRTLEEMRGTAYEAEVAVDSVVARLRAIPEYVSLFEQAFGAGTVIDAGRLATALAAFQRTLVAMDSPFDRFRAGDSTAMTPEQLEGMEEFDDAGCDRCHEGPMFSDFDLHAEGVPEHPALSEPDAGARRFRFRTPSLRNVALTAPYMHNGTLATLEDVLAFYDEGRSRNPNVADRRRGRDRDDRDAGGGEAGRGEGLARLSRQFRRVDDMSEREMRAIIAFLGALTDEGFDRRIPARVPSGLPPGGAIRPAGG
ncbi:MAG TPA: cytochrome c peroxidase [Longimicrobiales bacterium]|nr:cytochrome c peroxidase [Longimicrobiales bacterium]